ncbi:MAG: type III secretion system needle filament subunit SctF [Ottowia sp.]|nr:type III secretion system needle filament subunit SctF [Ottowia sp.]
MTVDISTINDQITSQAAQAGNSINTTTATVDVNNPASMLQAQFAVQKYAALVSYDSAMMQAFKTMISGIIAKIGS